MGVTIEPKFVREHRTKPAPVRKDAAPKQYTDQELVAMVMRQRDNEKANSTLVSPQEDTLVDILDVTNMNKLIKGPTNTRRHAPETLAIRNKDMAFKRIVAREHYQARLLKRTAQNVDEQAAKQLLAVRERKLSAIPTESANIQRKIELSKSERRTIHAEVKNLKEVEKKQKIKEVARGILREKENEALMKLVSKKTNSKDPLVLQELAKTAKRDMDQESYAYTFVRPRNYHASPDALSLGFKRNYLEFDKEEVQQPTSPYKPKRIDEEMSKRNEKTLVESLFSLDLPAPAAPQEQQMQNVIARKPANPDQIPEVMRLLSLPDTEPNNMALMAAYIQALNFQQLPPYRDVGRKNIRKTLQNHFKLCLEQYVYESEYVKRGTADPRLVANARAVLAEVMHIRQTQFTNILLLIAPMETSMDYNASMSVEYVMAAAEELHKRQYGANRLAEVERDLAISLGYPAETRNMLYLKHLSYAKLPLYQAVSKHAMWNITNGHKMMLNTIVGDRIQKYDPNLAAAMEEANERRLQEKRQTAQRLHQQRNNERQAQALQGQPAAAAAAQAPRPQGNNERPADMGNADAVAAEQREIERLERERAAEEDRLALAHRALTRRLADNAVIKAECIHAETAAAIRQFMAQQSIGVSGDMSKDIMELENLLCDRKFVDSLGLERLRVNLKLGPIAAKFKELHSLPKTYPSDEDGKPVRPTKGFFRNFGYHTELTFDHNIELDFNDARAPSKEIHSYVGPQMLLKFTRTTKHFSLFGVRSQKAVEGYVNLHLLIEAGRADVTDFETSRTAFSHVANRTTKVNVERASQITYNSAWVAACVNCLNGSVNWGRAWSGYMDILSTMYVPTILILIFLSLLASTKVVGRFAGQSEHWQTCDFQREALTLSDPPRISEILTINSFHASNVLAERFQGDMYGTPRGCVDYPIFLSDITNLCLGRTQSVTMMGFKNFAQEYTFQWMCENTSPMRMNTTLWNMCPQDLKERNYQRIRMESEMRIWPECFSWPESLDPSSCIMRDYRCIDHYRRNFYGDTIILISMTLETIAMPYCIAIFLAWAYNTIAWMWTVG